MGADTEIHERIFADYLAGRSVYIDAKNELIGLWKKTGNTNKSYLETMFAAWELFPEANDVVKYLSQRYHVCLISGAVDMWIQSVAVRLGVEDWYANTSLIWGENGELIDFDYTLNQARKKVEQKDAYLSKYQLSNQACVVIGDGANDKLLFEECASILVGTNPHPDLVSLASIQVDSLKDVMNYL